MSSILESGKDSSERGVGCDRYALSDQSSAFQDAKDIQKLRHKFFTNPTGLFFFFYLSFLSFQLKSSKHDKEP